MIADMEDEAEGKGKRGEEEEDMAERDPLLMDQETELELLPHLAATLLKFERQVDATRVAMSNVGSGANRLVAPLLEGLSTAPHEFLLVVEDSQQVAKQLMEQAAEVLRLFHHMHAQLNTTLLNAVIGRLSTQQPQTAARKADFQYETTVPALDASNPAIPATAIPGTTGEGGASAFAIMLARNAFRDTI